MCKKSNIKRRKCKLKRTLKGVLSLLLIVAMLSTMALGVSAADTVRDITVTDAGYTISANGTYHPTEGSTGLITVAPGVTQVTIVGNGAAWDSDPASETYGTVYTVPYEGLYIDCSAAPGITLTLRDIYIANGEEDYNVLNFGGAGNTLVYDGTIILDNEKNLGYALVHVGPQTELTIYGTTGSSAYLYKYDQAAGIGGDAEESCGTINMGVQGGANDFYFFMKGSKQGAVIGNGSNISDTPSTINFYSGVYNLLGIASGAVVGGSGGSSSKAAGNVYVHGGLLNLTVTWAGAAIGGGGFKQSDGTGGNDKDGGNLYVTGGSVRTYIGTNAVENNCWEGVTEAGVNDTAITANKVNAEGEAVYMLTVDTSAVDSETCTVAVDGVSYYSGPRYGYRFAYEDINRSGDGTTKPVVSTNPLGTPGNWLPLTGDKAENNLYFYVTGQNHTVTVNGRDYDCVWNAESETFTLTEQEEEETVLYGDVNGDGKISSADASLVLRYATGAAVDMNQTAADVNGDGKITASDATMILRYAVGSIQEFPVVNNG